MRRLLMTIAVLVGILSAGDPALAQIKLPPETHNAALRYWMAFGDLQDAPADQATQRLIEDTVAGRAAWDEAKLGAIVDRNLQAIQEMQRATKLPDCDWGLEYSRGARASIGQVARARALARLNILYGMRMMAKGQTQDAVDAWLDGVRFAQDLAKGGPLIFTLVARATLLDDFRAVTASVRAGKLQPEQKAGIAKSVQALPPDVFDWSAALGLEEANLEIVVKDLRQSRNPTAAYQEFYGQPPPANFLLPPEKEVIAFRAVIMQAQAALRLPSTEARPRVEQLQQRIDQSSDALKVGVPSLTKINESRAEVEASRSNLLQALGAS
ncbi:MAG TPA: hypothetical protein VLY23_10375 [Candidatus Acidoferrum sp.]|nr:hypothetical protein [Candidatus Acidoferrum sp.]